MEKLLRQLFENFNDEHPEIDENESFLMNIRPGEVVPSDPNWAFVRVGQTAYNNRGEQIPGQRPLFIVCN